MWDLIVSVPDHCLSFYLKRLFPSSSFWAWLKGSTPGCSLGWGVCVCVWGGGGGSQMF